MRSADKSHRMRALPMLPLPIFKQIIEYAVYEYSDPCRRMERIPGQALQIYALVAKDWVAPMREILAHDRLSTLTMKFEKANRHEIFAFKRKVLLRGDYIRGLKLTMGSFVANKEFFMLNHGLHLVNEVPIPWKEIFRRMPDLQRLDLSLLPLSSPHVVSIVDAASTYCMNVQALILPGKERQDFPSGDDVAPLVTKVYEAIERWYTKGGHGGLRQFTFPSRLDGDRVLHCTEYIDKVVQFCPNVEYLDGHKHSLNELDRLTCRDEWIISKRTWEGFNKNCVRLKEFNWVVVPFKDDFFRVFGAYPKPQLQHLTFSVNMLWNWRAYFRECADTDSSRRSPWGVQATDAKAALRACPALTHLEVCFYHPVDENILDNPMAMYEEEDYNFLVDGYPAVDTFNQEIFGDQFWIAAAEHCPLLERVCMWEVAERYNMTRLPVSSFTDRGLAALSKLTWLRFLELRSVNCTGNGLFALLNNSPHECTGQRDVQISLGGASSKSKLKFYNEVLKLLSRIATSQDVRFTSRRVVLRLTNACAAPVDFGWSKDYLLKLERVIEELKQKYPTLRLRVGMTGRKFGGFSGISEFGVYTGFSKPSMWYGWEDELDVQHGAVDDTFFYRDYDHSHHELDVDNLPLDYELDEDYDDYIYDDYGEIYDLDSNDDGYEYEYNY